VVAGDGPLEDVLDAVELADLLALGDGGSDPDGGVERREPGATSAPPPAEDAVRHYREVELAGDDLLLGERGRPGPGGEAGHQVGDLLVLGQELRGGRPLRPEAVAVHGQVASALVRERLEQRGREAV